MSADMIKSATLYTLDDGRPVVDARALLEALMRAEWLDPYNAEHQHEALALMAELEPALEASKALLVWTA